MAPPLFSLGTHCWLRCPNAPTWIFLLVWASYRPKKPIRIERGRNSKRKLLPVTGDTHSTFGTNTCQPLRYSDIRCSHNHATLLFSRAFSLTGYMPGPENSGNSLTMPLKCSRYLAKNKRVKKMLNKRQSIYDIHKPKRWCEACKTRKKLIITNGSFCFTNINRMLLGWSNKCCLLQIYEELNWLTV